MKNVLITTKHRGVFFAQITEEQLIAYKQKVSSDPNSPSVLTDLKTCRMAIYFGTTKGIMELASDGPTKSSKIGAAADIDVIHDITAVFSVTDKATEKWLTA